MTHTYSIAGMTCKNCAAKVRSRLLSIAGVKDAIVQLESPHATITMQRHIDINELQTAVNKAGHYTISSIDADREHAEAASWFNTYKPVLLIFAYIIAVTFLIQVKSISFNWLLWMQHFMAGFFLVFSFFKLLDIKAFAESYAMYDIVAKKWKSWGYIYPFAELALGIAYLLFPFNLFTNAITLSIMGISITGVLQAVFSKRAIQCACLGAVFKLPMSTITIIEDFLMIAMSVVMLIKMI